MQKRLPQSVTSLLFSTRLTYFIYILSLFDYIFIPKVCLIFLFFLSQSFLFCYRRLLFISALAEFLICDYFSTEIMLPVSRNGLATVLRSTKLAEIRNIQGFTSRARFSLACLPQQNDKAGNYEKSIIDNDQISISKKTNNGKHSVGPRLARLRKQNIKEFSEFLTDTFGRHHDYLRISITEKCNLRCRYCMPEEGVKLTPDEKLLTTDEIIRLAKIFASEGVHKIRLTGGEPTVRRDVVELVKRLHQIPGIDEICMTSNGLALHRKLPALFENGLTSLNLSMDTMVNGKFILITRRNGLSAVIKSLRKAIAIGVPKVKINTVVMRNINDDEIVNFVDLTKDYPIDVRFIEYMPFDGNKWSKNKMVPFKEILEKIAVKYPNIVRLQPKPGDTAKMYQVPTFTGRVGFITSMTSDFCSTCTRLRITNDGNLKVCLFGNEEVSLRDILRKGASDKAVLKVIGKAVKKKNAKHGGLTVAQLKDRPNRPMILIGG
mgnify:CR=1 FL=1